MVQRTLKHLLQHHNSKASILQCSAFFVVQLSYLYMTTGNTIVFTIWTFVGKVMSLLFNMLSRFVIASLPRNKCLLISCLQSLHVHSDVGAQENKICYCFHFFPFYLPQSGGTGCHVLSALKVSKFKLFQLQSLSARKNNFHDIFVSYKIEFIR